MAGQLAVAAAVAAAAGAVEMAVTTEVVEVAVGTVVVGAVVAGSGLSIRMSNAVHVSRLTSLSYSCPCLFFRGAAPAPDRRYGSPRSDACSMCLDARFVAGAAVKLMFHCPLCDYNECLACASKRGPDAAHAMLLKLAL